MNILLDSWSTQVMYQRTPAQLPPGVTQSPIPATGLRLNTVLGMMSSMGQVPVNSPTPAVPWNVAYTTGPVSPEQLEGVDVYISFTRYPDPQFGYQPGELTALKNFINGGGGILLLTDHGPFPGQTFSWPTNDMALAQLCGITLQPYAVTASDFMQMPLSGNVPPCLSYQVSRVAAHDSCIIVPPGNATTLAVFPSAAQEWFDPSGGSGGNWITPTSSCFSCLVSCGSGNIIVVGNSGMFADYGSPSPSCGMVTMDNNLQFFINCVSYLNNPAMVQPAPGNCQ